MIALHIADTSLTFFAKGMPHLVANDDVNYDKIMAGLNSDPQMDVDELIKLADVRISITEMGDGRLRIVGNEIYVGTQALHSIWVD